MANARIDLVSDNGQGLNNLFIHGFGRLKGKDRTEYAGKVQAIGLPGKTYLLTWDAGIWWRPLLPLALAAGGVAGVLLYKRWKRKHSPATDDSGVIGKIAKLSLPIIPALPLAAGLEFTRSKKRAEELGRSLEQLAAGIPDVKEAPLNLIGFSLGARIIHISLAEQDWSAYRLHDVCLMGGATDILMPDWNRCVAKIGGNLFNFFSKHDDALIVKPDKEKNIGREPIPLTRSNVINIETGLHHQREPSYGNHLKRLLIDLRLQYSS